MSAVAKAMFQCVENQIAFDLAQRAPDRCAALVSCCLLPKNAGKKSQILQVRLSKLRLLLRFTKAPRRRFQNLLWCVHLPVTFCWTPNAERITPTGQLRERLTQAVGDDLVSNR